MEKVKETIFANKTTGKPLVSINKTVYESMNPTEKLELLLTVKNWVKDQIDKIAES